MRYRTSWICILSKAHVHNETIVYHPPFGELRPKECHSPLFDGCFGERLQPSFDEWVWSPPTAKIHAHDLIWCISVLFNEFLSIIFGNCRFLSTCSGQFWRSTASLLCEGLRSEGGLAILAVCVQFTDRVHIQTNLPPMPFNRNLGLYFLGVEHIHKSIWMSSRYTLKGPTLPKYVNS